MNYLGRSLILIGIILVIIGAVVLLAPRVPWLGKLPGDIVVKRENFTFYFPLATSLLVSVILSLIFFLFRHKP